MWKRTSTGLQRGRNITLAGLWHVLPWKMRTRPALLAGVAKVGALLCTQRHLKRPESCSGEDQTLSLMAARGFKKILSTSAKSQAAPAQGGRRTREEVEAVRRRRQYPRRTQSRESELSVKDLRQGRIQVSRRWTPECSKLRNLATGARPYLLYESPPPGGPWPDPGRGGGTEEPRCGHPRRDRRPEVLSRPLQWIWRSPNRVTKSLRQPGSAMKPIVYLAAFREGTFNLAPVVAPDEPISVANGREQDVKWI